MTSDSFFCKKPAAEGTNETCCVLLLQLQQTQKELSRFQQLNKSLQVELQQERKSHPQVRFADHTPDAAEEPSMSKSLVVW